MIPRYQRILFWTLLGVSIVMAVALIRLREHAGDRINDQAADRASRSAGGDAQLTDPVAAPQEMVTLLEANDLDGSLAPVTRKLAMPLESGARARVLLRQLFADFAAPNSKHPLSAGPGVEEVFFMPVPGSEKPHSPAQSGSIGGQTAAQRAIVNLTSAFAENHPSGIGTETLTVLSIIATLHESFPTVQQVHFLVDGQPRETLAGHADLSRTYLTGVDTGH